MTTYAEFLAARAQQHAGDGFAPTWLPDWLFGFQRDLVDWAVRMGRAAIFADCGMGKTPMQLVWAENVRRHTGRPVLIVTPLAVSFQTQREAEKFGIDAAVSRDGSAAAGITITNYERLDRFEPDTFGGVVCDESSAIKSFDGQRRAIVTEWLRTLPYRLLSTATAAPNDYVELGTSSEALGYLGHMDMLGRFFVTQNRSSDAGGAHRAHGSRQRAAFDGSPWRFKGHAQDPFWQWVASWARAIRRPSDLGYDDAGFALSALEHHVVEVDASTPREGQLFDLPASGLHEEREETRRTITERCEAAAAALEGDEPAVAWCHLNDESSLLTKLIDGAVEVTGADSPDAKEDKLLAFTRGDIRVLVTKPRIGAWGLNWQHCARMAYFPSHSYEQYYQAVRRCWRFGQTRPVTVHVVTSPGGRGVLANLQRKATAAEAMFDQLVTHMRAGAATHTTTSYDTPMEVPAWAC